MAHALEVLRTVDVQKTLDVGCATGRYPLLLGRLGLDATGIDKNPESIMICEQRRENLSNVRFELMDATNMSFESESYDLVTCMMGTLSHASESERMEILKEMWRVLKQKGHVIISTWDPECTHTKYLQIYRREDILQIRRNSINKEQMRELLSKVGFKVSEILPFCYLPDDFLYELDLRPGFIPQEVVRSVLLLDQDISRLFPDLPSQMYLVHGEKP